MRKSFTTLIILLLLGIGLMPSGQLYLPADTPAPSISALYSCCGDDCSCCENMDCGNPADTTLISCSCTVHVQLSACILSTIGLQDLNGVEAITPEVMAFIPEAAVLSLDHPPQASV
ncbi:hypothetical protein KQI63_09435 [bacterium]|nr:hypothetical protein [bacterium]